MKCVVALLFAALVHGAAVVVVDAFSPVRPTTTTTSSSSSFGVYIQSSSRTTALHYLPDNYNRAVECATHYGKCHLDELEQLANELNEFQHDEFKGSCFFEKDEEACEKDWQEMNHVKQILKVQMKLHQMTDNYVKGQHEDEETFDLADIF